jgi:hypothetical protein
MEFSMAERRKYSRTRVLKGAKIVLGATSVLDCVVRDLTNGGARIKIPNAVDIPEDVAITLDGGRTCRPCHVAWRGLHETGLDFIDPTHQPPPKR